MERHSENVIAPARKLVMYFAIAEGVLLTGNLAVRICLRQANLPPWIVTGLAVSTAIPLVVFAVFFFRIVRTQLDEMIQRIVYESLAFALVIFLPIAGLYVNLRTAGILQTQLDPPELLLVPSILAVVGILISWSRLK